MSGVRMACLVATLVAGLANGVWAEEAVAPRHLPRTWSEAFSHADKLLEEAKGADCNGNDRICALGRMGLAQSAVSVPTKLHEFCARATEAAPPACQESAVVASRMETLAARAEEVKGQTAWAGATAWRNAPERAGRTLRAADIETFIDLTRAALRDSACPGQRRVCLAGRIEAVVEADQMLRTANACGALLPLEQGACNRGLVRLSLEIQRLGREELVTALSSQDWIDAVAWGPFIEGDAFLLAQHLDDDPAFQNWILARLKIAMQSGRADPVRYAYLSDRIEVNAGHAQSYGTQGECVTTDGKGTWRPMPIRDVDKIEARRAAMNMRPFSTYSAEMSGYCS